MDGKSVEPSIAKACVTEFMKAVKRNVLKGFRCQLGDNFLTVYPNIQLSVKDTEDPKTHEPIVATAEMLNAANGRSQRTEPTGLHRSREVQPPVLRRGELAEG